MGCSLRWPYQPEKPTQSLAVTPYIVEKICGTTKSPPDPSARPAHGHSRSTQAAEGEKFAIKLERLGRGSSFGEAELLAAAEAEEGAAALAAALKHRQNSQKLEERKARQQQRQQQEQSQAKPVAMLVSAEGGAAAGSGSSASVDPSAAAAVLRPPRRKSTPGEGPGRGAARGGGVPRAARAVCVSEEDCEVMAVPRHLFANLLDELGGPRRKLELQVCLWGQLVCARSRESEREREGGREGGRFGFEI